MPLVVLRHGERLDYVEREAWFAKNPNRQWDPPLSEKGRKQAVDAGEHIQKLLENYGLPPVTRAFSSPLVRCVETAILASRSANHQSKVASEPALAEGGSMEWYYSWGIPGANGTWGGPRQCRTNEVEVPRDLAHRAALQPAGELFLSAPELQSRFGDDIILDARPFLGAEGLKYNWDLPEPRDETKARVGNFAQHCHETYPGETVLLCAHGGGCAMICDYLTSAKADVCGYTGIFVLQHLGDEERWIALEKGNVDHLDSADELGLGAATSKSQP
jgi:broad specificity phosphatase PhoE